MRWRRALVTRLHVALCARGILGMSDLVTEQKEVFAMRLHTYRDESHSFHFDLVGGRDHPWTIDLVTVMAAAVFVVGFACALVAPWVQRFW